MDKMLFRKFLLHHAGAIKRGIDFELTYDQWLKIWEDSGHLKDRGNKVGGYVMGREGDTGPYSVDNVYITTMSGNIKDGYRFRKEKKEITRKQKQLQLLKKAKEDMAGKESIRKARLKNKAYYAERMREKFNYSTSPESLGVLSTCSSLPDCRVKWHKR